MTVGQTRRQELKTLTQEVAERVDGKAVHVFVGTWLDRPGCSLEVRMQSKAIGRRVIVHKWDDEETCSVRYVMGTWWRPKSEKEMGVEFARADGVTFNAESIADVAGAMLRHAS